MMTPEDHDAADDAGGPVRYHFLEPGTTESIEAWPRRASATWPPGRTVGPPARFRRP